MAGILKDDSWKAAWTLLAIIIGKYDTVICAHSPVLLAVALRALGIGAGQRRNQVDWPSQIVLITGGKCLSTEERSSLTRTAGGSGIGALLAETLALNGATVVVLTKYPPKQDFQQGDQSAQN